MSKQYMDFAPRKAAGATSARGVAGAKSTPASGVRGVRSTPVRSVARHSVSGVRPAGVTPSTAARNSATKRSVGGAVKPTSRVAGVTRATGSTRVTTKPSASTVKSATKSTRPVAQKSALSVRNEPALGVIEDLNPKFVKTDVPKRPLSQAPHFNTTKTGVAAAKARKIGVRGTSSVEKTVENSRKTGNKGVYSPPKSPFINQGKVQKRPLSKNVYQKKIVIPKEEPKGPVTIISKPEKQAHVGLIVTIILTIILGAAAGTVAFLLLPK